MQVRRMLAVGVMVVVLSAVCALAVQRAEEPSPERKAMYRVTPWPDNTPERPYYQEVERYLNRMAADGWRLNTELAGQGAKMMVFQREVGR